jgi:hypothetical protein
MINDFTVREYLKSNGVDPDEVQGKYGTKSKDGVGFISHWDIDGLPELDVEDAATMWEGMKDNLNPSDDAPTVAEQLDAIWDQMSLTTELTPKAEAMLTRVTAAKAKKKK